MLIHVDCAVCSSGFVLVLGGWGCGLSELVRNYLRICYVLLTVRRIIDYLSGHYILHNISLV